MFDASRRRVGVGSWSRRANWVSEEPDGAASSLIGLDRGRTLFVSGGSGEQSVVVELWSGVAFSTVGVTAAFGGALALTAYLLMAERERQHRDAASLSFYGFLFAALLWAVIQPLWDFPWSVLSESVSLQGNLSEYSAPVWLLVTFIVVIGTMVTFSLLTGSLRHINATRASIVATLEPVVATVVAWAWLGETFGPTQLVGGAVVIAGILVAQSAR